MIVYLHPLAHVFEVELVTSNIHGVHESQEEGPLARSPGLPLIPMPPPPKVGQEALKLRLFLSRLFTQITMLEVMTNRKSSFQLILLSHCCIHSVTTQRLLYN